MSDVGVVLVGELCVRTTPRTRHALPHSQERERLLELRNLLFRHRVGHFGVFALVSCEGLAGGGVVFVLSAEAHEPRTRVVRRGWEAHEFMKTQVRTGSTAARSSSSQLH